MRDPLFIVAPPRSFTSVVGAIIGQHPQAYGLPEINMSLADTLGDIWASAGVVKTFSTNGIMRALAELHEGSQSEEAVLRARQWILRHPHWTSTRVLRHINDLVGDRMLVEKSPRNVLLNENLHRLVDAFPEARFLHLTRHPKTQGESVLALTGKMGMRRVRDPENNWLRSHRTIVRFSRQLRPAHYMRLQGEVLLRDLPFYLRQICQWLDLDSDEDSIAAMMRPEDSVFARMGPPSAPMGADPNFLENPKLDFDRLAKIKIPALDEPVVWKPDGEGLSAKTRRLALEFGYG